MGAAKSFVSWDKCLSPGDPYPSGNIQLLSCVYKKDCHWFCCLSLSNFKDTAQGTALLSHKYMYLFVTMFLRAAEKTSQEVCRKEAIAWGHPPILQVTLSFWIETLIHRNLKYGFSGLKIAIWGFITLNLVSFHSSLAYYLQHNQFNSSAC